MTAAGEFAAPTRIVAGRGCVEATLADELRDLGVGTVAVIADRGFAGTGRLDALLGDVADVAVPVCALIDEDPDVAACEEAALGALRADAAAVLAVGGGSAMCAAKAVAIRLTNAAPLDRYEGSGRLPAAPAPSIAVPTTAGSGSEVSNVVVLHDPRRERHLVIRGRGYEPRVALLDGELLRTLPARPMIAAALDALSHALESLWVRGATRFTTALARAAAAGVRGALSDALNGDGDAMQALMEASAMANLACGNSGLGLVHALELRPRCAPPARIPERRPAARGRRLQPRPGRARRRCRDRPARSLYREIGFRPRFETGELPRSDAELMVAAAIGNPFSANNVREAGPDDLRALLALAGAGA